MVLKNRIIVILGNIYSDGIIKGTSLFIARNLAKDNKVFYIYHPLTLKDYVNYICGDRAKINRKKFSLAYSGVFDTDLPNLTVVIIPPVLPINFLKEGSIFRALLQFNEDLICWYLKKVLRKENIKDFIYINSFNFHYPNIAKRINPELTVYQCLDPMIIAYDMKHGVDSEYQLVKESDVIICTSKALYKEKKLVNENTYFVPNGTDSNLSQVTADLHNTIHPKLIHLSKPIIGYLGTIERRIDYDLLQCIINGNPDKNFVFAGPVSDDYFPKAIYQFSNAHFIGSVPYAEVPQLISAFDVAIIPFKKDTVSDTIFPIKLFEYLSAGKPVIATDFNPDLAEHTDDLVEYCSDATTFSAAIDRALKTDNYNKTQQRKALAELNTWEKRSDQISKIISSYLKRPTIKNQYHNCSN